MVKLDLRKAEEPEIKTTTSVGDYRVKDAVTTG